MRECIERPSCEEKFNKTFANKTQTALTCLHTGNSAKFIPERNPEQA